MADPTLVATTLVDFVATFGHEVPVPVRSRIGEGVGVSDGGATRAEMCEHLAGVGTDPTDILDRERFRTICVREPGGVVFEFSTPDSGRDRRRLARG